jgi:uracil-DNA glycosylase
MEDAVYEYHLGLIAEPECKGCPLEGGKKVPPEGNPRAAIMLVGDHPGQLDVEEGRPFTGHAGSLLNRLLARADIDRRSCFVTQAILCKPKTVVIDGKPVAPDSVVKIAAKFCKSRLDKELAMIKPRVIVAFSAQALKSVYGQNASLKDRRGAIHIMDVGKTTADLIEEENEQEYDDEDVVAIEEPK